MGEYQDTGDNSTSEPWHASHPRGQSKHIAHVNAAAWHSRLDVDAENREDMLKESTVQRQTVEGEYEEIEFDPPDSYWV